MEHKVHTREDGKLEFTTDKVRLLESDCGRGLIVLRAGQPDPQKGDGLVLLSWMDVKTIVHNWMMKLPWDRCCVSHEVDKDTVICVAANMYEIALIWNKGD